MRKCIVRKSIFVFLFLFSMACGAYAQSSVIEFRFIISEDQVDQDKDYQVCSYVKKEGLEPREYFISPDVALDENDIQDIKVIPKGQGHRNLPLLNLIMTDSGAKKLEQITSENIRRQMAVIINGEVFSTPYILSPMTSGRVRLSNWKIDTSQKAREFVEKLGF